MDNNILKANEGMIYTNGETYGSTIYLGVNDSAENWHEIPIEEYESIMEKQSEMIEGRVIDDC